jgi:hypothetical protein
VIVPVNTVDGRLVVSVITVKTTERTLPTFSVDTTLRIVRVEGVFLFFEQERW